MNQSSLSVFIPVYNEVENIENIISAAVQVLESSIDDYEILIINDGSTDGSKEKILRWTEKSSRIRLINHGNNLGYGSALRTGFKNAGKDLIFYTDADMPVCLDEIKKIPPFMGNYDLVIGYRINREDTIRRFFYSKIYNFLLRILLKVKVKDANFSFKCIRKEALRKCNLKAKSVFIDGELLAEAFKNNLIIKEIPVVYIPRKHGWSNFDSFRAAVYTMKELMSYWVHRLFIKKEKRMR